MRIGIYEIDSNQNLLWLTTDNFNHQLDSAINVKARVDG